MSEQGQFYIAANGQATFKGRGAIYAGTSAATRSIAPSLYDAVLAFYHQHGVTPAIAQEAIQMQTIVNLVSAGLGLALVPRAMTLLQRPGIVYRALPAALAEGAPRAETSLVWPPDAPPAVQRFVAFVRSQAGRAA